jgi:hypothetical protein
MEILTPIMSANPGIVDFQKRLAGTHSSLWHLPALLFYLDASCFKVK